MQDCRFHPLCWVLGIMLLATTSAAPLRDVTCDDTMPLAAHCKHAQVICAQEELLARKHGCYICVDATTCTESKGALHPSAISAPDKIVPDAAAQAIIAPANIAVMTAETTRTPIVGAAIVVDHDHDSEGILVDDMRVDGQIALASGNALSPNPAVSNYLFLIPACLALVSLGLALRSYAERAKRGIAGDDDEQEEINPFCNHPQEVESDEQDEDEDEEVDIELGRQHSRRELLEAMRGTNDSRAE